MADPHLKMIRDVTECGRLRGLPENRLEVGALASVPDLRALGCCDSSPHRHARMHFHESGHPIIQSFEPGEDWRWCYVHEAEV